MLGRLCFVFPFIESKRAKLSSPHTPPLTFFIRKTREQQQRQHSKKQINHEWREVLLPRFLFMVNEETARENERQVDEPHGQTNKTQVAM